MKVDIKQACRSVVKATNAHKPEVLTGFGVGVMLIAIPLAVIATVQANKKIEEKKEEIAHKIQEESGDIDTPVDKSSIEVPVKEVIKSTWYYYIPTAIAAGVGAFCNISSTKEGLKRTAAMAAAYQLSESAFSEFRKATQEVVGEKKEEEIQKKVMRDRMELITDPDGHIVNVYDTRDGTQLCFDYWSGRYFYSDVDYIKSVINRLGADLLRETMAYDDAFISYNDIYREIGLPDAGSGEDQIWRVKKEGVPELRASTYMTVDERPCWVMAFKNPPSTVPPYMMDRL